jgi:hypothetical protein
MAVNLHATHYRFGVDELAESTHGWHAAEDTNPAQGAIPNDTPFLLRFTVQETGGTAAANTDQQFQCSLNGGAFQNITTSSTVVKAVPSVAFTNGANCTKRLTGTGTFESSGAGCTEDGLSGGPANDIAASGNSETECGLQIVGTDVGPGDTITFRLTSPDFTITNDVVPTLTTELGTVAGDLAGTDTVDVASLSGGVLVEGDVATDEAVDVGAMAGDVVVAGDAAATEAADVFAAAGVVEDASASGDLAALDAADAAAATGAVLVAGALAATDAADVVAGAGDVFVAGAMAAVGAQDAAALAGDVVVAGALASTEAHDAAAAAGGVLVEGDLAAVGAPDVLSATSGAVTVGDLAAGETPDSLAAAGVLGQEQAPSTAVAAGLGRVGRVLTPSYPIVLPRPMRSGGSVAAVAIGAEGWGHTVDRRAGGAIVATGIHAYTRGAKCGRAGAVAAALVTATGHGVGDDIETFMTLYVERHVAKAA